MSATINSSHLSWIATILSFVLALWVLRRRDGKVQDWLGAAGYVLIGWTLYSTLEYWVFGPASYLLFADEGGSLPEFLEIARNPRAFPYAHGVNGGTDLMAQFPVGVQFVALEAGLFKVLPSWLAIACNKILVTGLGAWGMFALARSVGAGRIAALALGCVFSVSHIYVTEVTLSHGVGLAILPLAILVVVVRNGQPWYFASVLGIALLNAASSTITLSFLSLGCGLVAAALFLGVRHWWRLVAALGIIFVVEVANWSEYLLATAQVASESARLAVRGHAMSLRTALGFTWEFLNWKFGILCLPAILASAGASFALGASWRWRGLAMLALIVMIGPILQVMPWDLVGLRFLLAIQWVYYLSFAIVPLLLLHLARLSSETQERFPRLQSWSIALVLAVAISLSSGRKVLQWIDLVGVGGQSMITRVGNLASRPWAPNGLFRVASVPYRFVPGYVHGYGLQSSDGYLNLIPLARTEFWREVIRPQDGSPMSLVDNRLYLFDPETFDGRCCASIDVAGRLDLDLLGMVNTRFIISFVPLHGGGLTKVSGPPDWVTGRRERPLRQKLAEDIASIFNPPDAFIYELPRVLPRAYFATSVNVIDGDPTAQSFYARVKSTAPERGITVRREDAEALGGAVASAEIVDFSETEGGMSATVHAPQGGILVLNYVHSRFWEANVDGAPGALVPVNGTQMGLYLAPGAREVSLAYQRPHLTGSLRRH